MSYLKWTEAYSVNNAEIDEQHKKLFSLVNELHDAMKEHRGGDLLGTVIALVEYTDYHFKTEERLLRTCSYPAYDEHKEMHESLTRRAQSMKEGFESGSTPTPIEVLLLIANWLNNHILDEDRKYKPYIHGCAEHEERAT
jgi:hemerythrin